MKKQKKRKTSLYRRLLIVFLELIVVLNILRYAAYFKKETNDGKIHVILDNVMVENLKNDVYVDNNEIVYLSEDDLREFFDKNIYKEKEQDGKMKIVSTYDNKIVTLKEDENHAFINGVRTKIKGTLLNKENKYYIPISELQNIYNIELTYIKDRKIVDIELLKKEKKVAHINKDINLKYKMTDISKNLKPLSQGETVTIVKKMKGNWTRVKTQDGYIGYVKNKRLSNEKTVRNDLEETKYDESKIDFSKIKTLKRDDFEENFEDLISNYDSRKELINKVVEQLITTESQGIKLDFSNVTNTENYYRFLIELKPFTKDYGMYLIVKSDSSLNNEKLKEIADSVVNE